VLHRAFNAPPHPPRVAPRDSRAVCFHTCCRGAPRQRPSRCAQPLFFLHGRFPWTISFLKTHLSFIRRGLLSAALTLALRAPPPAICARLGGRRHLRNSRSGLVVQRRDQVQALCDDPRSRDQVFDTAAQRLDRTISRPSSPIDQRSLRRPAQHGVHHSFVRRPTAADSDTGTNRASAMNPCRPLDRVAPRLGIFSFSVNVLAASEFARQRAQHRR